MREERTGNADVGATGSGARVACGSAEPGPAALATPDLAVEPAPSVPDAASVLDDVPASLAERRLTRARFFAVGLAVVLVVGLAARSLLLIALGGDTGFHAVVASGDMAAVETRFLVSNTAESLASAAEGIYCFGSLLLLFHLVWHRLAFGYKRILVFTLAVLAASLLCTVPFALVPTVNAGDALFPLWGLVPTLLVFCVLFLLENLYCTRTRRLAG